MVELFKVCGGTSETLEFNVDAIRERLCCRGDQSIEIRVPASSANLGCGFDTLGLALEKTMQEISMSKQEMSSSPTLDWNENLILKVCQFNHDYWKGGEIPKNKINLKLNNGIPLGRGLGSSGAAIVAGILLDYLILIACCSEQEVVKFKSIGIKDFLAVAYEFENHFDNVGPSLTGSLIACHCEEDLKMLNVFPTSPQLANGSVILLAVVPNSIQTNTKESRGKIASTLTIPEHVQTLQRTITLIRELGSPQMNPQVTRKCLWESLIHTPARANLITPNGFQHLTRVNESASARWPDQFYGLWVSGSGPTVMAMVGELVEQEFRAVLGDLWGERLGSGACEIVKLRPSQQGAQIL